MLKNFYDLWYLRPFREPRREFIADTQTFFVLIENVRVHQ